MIGLDLNDLSVDGSITKAVGGGDVAGRSPVDRGKLGTKRSVACDKQGIPLHLVAARANDHDSPLLEPTLAGIIGMIGPLPQHPNTATPAAAIRSRPRRVTCAQPPISEIGSGGGFSNSAGIRTGTSHRSTISSRIPSGSRKHSVRRGGRSSP